MTKQRRLPAPSAQFVIRREKQVSWFDTRQLVATGSQALAASIVGSMSGRREIMAALEPEVAGPFDYSGHDELWLDYVADTGDGWNATASVTWLVGRDGLLLESNCDPTEQPVPLDCFTEGLPQAGDGQLMLGAGDILLLGGDQVYPTASPDTYQHRFTDPLRCSRWYAEPPRSLFAIPGNHDWYDGLTSFIRLFCQSPASRRWFGCWQAKQRRSYFSLKLPHRWWLWGVDMALEDDLDPPQLDYFRDRAKELNQGDRLILLVPSPTWLKRSAEAAAGARNISADKLDLILELTRQPGHQVEVPLVLTGDLHYYARHEEQCEGCLRHYVVCGGGGAFGLGTLQVPEVLRAPGSAGPPSTSELKAAFPDKEDSGSLRGGVFNFPFKNPAFTLGLTVAQAVTLWLLSSAQSDLISRLMAPDLSFANLFKLFGDAAKAAVVTPSLIIWLSLLVYGFGSFASSGRPPFVAKWKGWSSGILHGLLQIAGAFVCVWLAAQGIGHLLVYGLEEPWRLVTSGIGDNWATLGIAGLISYFYCGFLFAAYLFFGHRLIGLHDQEVFSAQGIQDYKAFLKLHVSPKGLTLYPIGVRHHVSDWKEAPGVTLNTRSRGIFRKLQEVIVPPGAQRVMDPCEPLRPHLIETPIFIPASDCKDDL